MKSAGLLAAALLAIAAVLVLLERSRPAGAPDELEPTRSSDQYLSERSGSSRLRLVDHQRPDLWRELIFEDGGSVRLPQPPQRIVSQSLASDEILLALDLGERLIAVTRFATSAYSCAVEEARAVPNYVTNSSEHILGLRPDLVFMASYSTLETVHQLQRGGATILQLGGYESLQGIEDSLRAVGFAVGGDEAAERLIAEMGQRIQRVMDRIPRDRPPPRVICYWEGAVRARRTTFDDVMNAVGAVNVASEAGLEGWPRVSAEQVLLWQPEYYFVGAAPEEESAVRETLLSHSALGAALRSGRGEIVVVPMSLFSTVSHHIATFVEVAARELYPELVRAPAATPEAER